MCVVRDVLWVGGWLMRLLFVCLLWLWARSSSSVCFVSDGVGAVVWFVFVRRGKCVWCGCCCCVCLCELCVIYCVIASGVHCACLYVYASVMNNVFVCVV